MTTNPINFDLLPDALAESEDRVSDLEFDLHRLVAAPTDTALIASAFRQMHTIKSDFAYCNIAPITDHFHALEGVLQSLRERRFQCSALVAEAVLQCTIQLCDSAAGLLQHGLLQPEPDARLARFIARLADSHSQADADEAARQLLLLVHGALGEPDASIGIDPALAAQARGLGEALHAALAQRLPGWQDRAAWQQTLVAALNLKGRFGVDAALLDIAVLWHDLGLLARPDMALRGGHPKIDPTHPDAAASWLLALDARLAPAADWVRQHHQAPQPTSGLPALPVAVQLMACADLCFERVAGRTGEDFQRGLLRTVFDVSGGLDRRFHASVVAAFEAVAQEWANKAGPTV
jgi:chemotaxis protein histidine kinase CheA